VFIAPIWLWLHYSNRSAGNAGISQQESQRLEQLTLQAKQMQKRIDTLEELLDVQHTEWRDR
jgi:phage shock protein B